MSCQEVVRLAKFCEKSESKVKLFLVSSLTELLEKGIFIIFNLSLTETNLLIYVWLGAAGFNLKKEVCEIITVQQEVVAEFEVLVYLNGQRELLFIRETTTPTSSSQIPDATHISAAEFPAPDASGVSTQHTDYQEPSTSFNSHSAPSSTPLSTSINTSSTETVAVATNDPSAV